MKATVTILALFLSAVVFTAGAAEAGGKTKKSGNASPTGKSGPGIESMALNNPDSAYRIGRIYETEGKTQENFKEAARYYTMAVAKGHSASKARLAYLLATGKAGRAEGDRVKLLLGGSLDALTRYEIFEIAIVFDEGLKVPADGAFALHLYLDTPARLVEDAELRAAAILVFGKNGAARDLPLAEKVLLSYEERHPHAERTRLETKPLFLAIQNSKEASSAQTATGERATSPQ